jgi:predicted metal-dependent peptidase
MHPVLEKATVQLILSQPFIANIILSCDVHEDKTIPTACTDGSFIKFNPDWLESLAPGEFSTQLGYAQAIMAHEAYHVALLHMFRRQGRIPEVWNLACDAVINDMITTDGFKLPPGCFMIPGSKDKTAEEVYAELMKDAKIVKMKLPSNALRDDLQDPKDDEGGSAAEKEIKASIKVQKAADIARAQGQLPGSLQRMLGEALDGKIPWKQLLREAVTTIMRKDDYTWARMNRRHIYNDVYLPSMEGTQCGPLAIAFDTSGSIGDAELGAFLAELNAIFEDVCPEAVHVLACDADVAHFETITPDDLPLTPDTFSKMMKGGGGTAFRPVFEYLQNHNIPSDMIIYFTDLCGSDFGNEPQQPVIWITTASENAPWGKVIKLDL